MASNIYCVKAQWENLRSIAYSDVGSSYTAVGDPFLYPSRLFKIYNSTNQDLYISNDGINDKDIVPATSSFIYDFASDKSNQGGTLDLPANTTIYVLYPSSAPTSGNVYVSTIYASDN